MTSSAIPDNPSVISYQTPGENAAGSAADTRSWIVNRDDLILVTGATGFIGSALIRNLLDRGFNNLRCLVRPTSEANGLRSLADSYHGRATLEVLNGNLLSREDCTSASRGAKVIYHLAA